MESDFLKKLAFNTVKFPTVTHPFIDRVSEIVPSPYPAPWITTALYTDEV